MLGDYKYKNAVEQEYLDIYNKKLESIDDKGKLLLFKTLKTEYKLEFYLKYPDNKVLNKRSLPLSSIDSSFLL
jgi:hypothetical protein